MISILVPVLNRPANAAKVRDSIHQNTEVEHTIVFLCTPSDHAEIEACQATGETVVVTDWDGGPGDWARKINLGVRVSDTPWLLLGADDLRFHPRWDTNALRVHEQTGKGLIGTNDLCNPTVMRGLHSTHPLVSRAYTLLGTIDEPDKLLHEGYQHQWVDTELVGTAKHRGQWAFAKNSHVQHLHPICGGEMTDTHRKAMSTPKPDQQLYHRRRKLWS